jgi:CheY-like chemotaxis protein
MRVLFLDDDVTRYEILSRLHPEWKITWVQRVSAFLGIARREFFDLIMMDHDLGYSESWTHDLLPGGFFVGMMEFSGVNAASELVSNPGNAVGTRVVIHSNNPDGADRMFGIFKREGWEVEKSPF